MYRDHTKEIQIGDRKIGGGNPVLIQSMCNTKTENVAATVEQIHRLEDAGCDIIRVAVPTMEAAAAIREIKKQIHIPLVADIHFDYRLAIAAIESGADKIRINPGQHRGERAGEGCRRQGEMSTGPDPRGSKQWLSGERPPRKIRRCDSGSSR